MLNNMEQYRLHKEIRRAWDARFLYYRLENIPQPEKLVVKLLPEEAMSEFYTHKHVVAEKPKQTGRYVRPIPPEIANQDVKTPMMTVKIGVDKHARIGICECGQIFVCEEV